MAHLVVSALQHVEFWRDSFPIWHKWSLAWECVACNDLWPWPVSSRSFSDDFAIKLLKYGTSLVRRGVNNPIFSNLVMCCTWEGVSHAMTFDLDLYLQSYLAVTLPILWIIFICGTNTTPESRDDVSCIISRPIELVITPARNRPLGNGHWGPAAEERI